MKAFERMRALLSQIEDAAVAAVAESAADAVQWKCAKGDDVKWEERTLVAPNHPPKGETVLTWSKADGFGFGSFDWNEGKWYSDFSASGWKRQEQWWARLHGPPVDRPVEDPTPPLDPDPNSRARNRRNTEFQPPERPSGSV